MKIPWQSQASLRQRATCHRRSRAIPALLRATLPIPHPWARPYASQSLGWAHSLKHWDLQQWWFIPSWPIPCFTSGEYICIYIYIYIYVYIAYLNIIVCVCAYDYGYAWYALYRWICGCQAARHSDWNDPPRNDAFGKYEALKVSGCGPLTNDFLWDVSWILIVYPILYYYIYICIYNHIISYIYVYIYTHTNTFIHLHILLPVSHHPIISHPFSKQQGQQVLRHHFTEVFELDEGRGAVQDMARTNQRVHGLNSHRDPPGHRHVSEKKPLLMQWLPWRFLPCLFTCLFFVENIYTQLEDF